MRRNWNHFGQLAALAALGAIVAWVSQAVAQEESVVVPTPTPADQPAMPPPALAAPAMPAPAAQPVAQPVAGPVAAIRPCIDYRTHRSARRMLRCNPEVQVLMQAQNPADCCLYEIPLCIPCCCQGAPCVSSDCGLFGRGVVEYCWPCGFEAKVVFRARGDVVVHYRG